MAESLRLGAVRLEAAAEDGHDGNARLLLGTEDGARFSEHLQHLVVLCCSDLPSTRSTCNRGLSDQLSTDKHYR